MPAIQTSDAILIDRFRRGDSSAMETLVNRHMPRMYLYAMRLSRDHDLASDVVASALIHMNRAAGGFKGLSSFSTWLHTVTRNCYLDISSRARVRRAESLDQELYESDGFIAKQFESLSPSPHEHAEKKAQVESLSLAIQALPAYQRSLILMFHAEMLTYDEIAQKLEVPIGTVKSRLFRARLALRCRLVSEKSILCDPTEWLPCGPGGAPLPSSNSKGNDRRAFVSNYLRARAR